MASSTKDRGNKEEKRKEVANDEGPPDPPEGWTRCHAYLERKSRFCRQEVLDGQCYCGNHQHLVLANNNLLLSGSNNNKRKRILCPVDPTHHIFEDMVEKHVAKCPKYVAQQKQKEEHFYRLNCNCGGHGETLMQEGKTSMEEKDSRGSKDFEWAKRVAIRVLQVHQKLFVAGETELLEPDAVRHLTVDDIHNALLLQDLSQPELDAGLGVAISDYRIKSGGQRHLHQQASLVGHLRRIGVLDTLDRKTVAKNNSDDKQYSAATTRTILELGAGRGMTGLVVAGVSALSKKTVLTMVERGSSRSRAEKFLRRVRAFPDSFRTQSNCLDLSAVDWNRIKCDLAHVDMAAVMKKQIEQKAKRADNDELIVVAKHLCGVGTDLALKSLEPIKDNLSACIMSTCCHGACLYKDYVGRDYLKTAMLQSTTASPALLTSFGNAEFELLRLWSSGTVRDEGNRDDGNTESGETDADFEEHSKHQVYNSSMATTTTTTTTCNTGNVGVTRVVEALQLKCGAHGLGRACQRLIDYGRHEYLRKVLFVDGSSSNKEELSSRVQLLYYVPNTVSPQNAVLIAHR